jgi:hypothetical protein
MQRQAPIIHPWATENQWQLSHFSPSLTSNNNTKQQSKFSTFPKHSDAITLQKFQSTFLRLFSLQHQSWFHLSIKSHDYAKISKHPTLQFTSKITTNHITCKMTQDKLTTVLNSASPIINTTISLRTKSSNHLLRNHFQFHSFPSSCSWSFGGFVSNFGELFVGFARSSLAALEAQKQGLKLHPGGFLG